MVINSSKFNARAVWEIWVCLTLRQERGIFARRTSIWQHFVTLKLFYQPKLQSLQANKFMQYFFSIFSLQSICQVFIQLAPTSFMNLSFETFETVAPHEMGYSLKIRFPCTSQSTWRSKERSHIRLASNDLSNIVDSEHLLGRSSAGWRLDRALLHSGGVSPRPMFGDTTIWVCGGGWGAAVLRDNNDFIFEN